MVSVRFNLFSKFDMKFRSNLSVFQNVSPNRAKMILFFFVTDRVTCGAIKGYFRHMEQGTRKGSGCDGEVLLTSMRQASAAAVAREGDPDTSSGFSEELADALPHRSRGVCGLGLLFITADSSTSGASAIRGSRITLDLLIRLPHSGTFSAPEVVGSASSSASASSSGRRRRKLRRTSAGRWVSRRALWAQSPGSSEDEVVAATLT